DAADAGAFAFLIAPVAPAALAAAIAIAARRFEELQAAVHDKQMLQQAIETRKLVERAKAVFMKRMKIDEPEAHRRLQRESQNRRIGLAELAKRILENEEMVTA
ncbi:MAG TPA: ANTAR domain-containing protein, partial [Tepidisphaeraceae bacterium]|nr:ANTAR domain-containing protein [Tepidisphaeraceae bacterium]